jgi:hypothetical protein
LTSCSVDERPGPPKRSPTRPGDAVEAHDPRTIGTAGMEIDGTLLVFDYLNGERPLLRRGN